MTTMDSLSSLPAATPVLVVDDNPDHRRLIGLRLGKLGLTDVREAGSGEAALEQLGGVALVLCDYQLPGMNGLETLAEIRRRSDASVIMVTGAGSETLVVEALRTGAVDYLVKDPGFLNALPLVIERAWRHHDLVLRAAELERLSILVTSAGEREELLGGIVSGARRLLHGDTCILFVERDGALVAEATDGAPVAESGLLEAKVRAGADMLEQALQDTSPTRHLVAPLHSDGTIVGSLAVVTREPRSYAQAEIRLAQTFASFAGVALARVQRTALQRELVERLQSLADLRRDLITSVSHELRTPLTCIMGFGVTLGQRWEQLSDEQRRDMVARIQDHTHELTDQVDRLLDVAALESGRLEGNPRAIDLTDEINDTVALLAPLVEGRLVEVEIPALRVIADPLLLRRAMTNLISNAVKYSPAGTPISIRATKAHGFAQLDVIDRGVGLTPEEAQRAFEPFWRAGSALRDATRGAGVGLALVREYARVMGGEAFANSRPGVGSVFSLTLPLDTSASVIATG
jgi:two-component system sensor histidine kinase KdpD